MGQLHKVKARLVNYLRNQELLFVSFMKKIMGNRSRICYRTFKTDEFHKLASTGIQHVDI